MPSGVLPVASPSTQRPVAAVSRRITSTMRSASSAARSSWSGTTTVRNRSRWREPSTVVAGGAWGGGTCFTGENLQRTSPPPPYPPCLLGVTPSGPVSHLHFDRPPSLETHVQVGHR